MQLITKLLIAMLIFDQVLIIGLVASDILYMHGAI